MTLQETQIVVSALTQQNEELRKALRLMLSPRTEEEGLELARDLGVCSRPSPVKRKITATKGATKCALRPCYAKHLRDAKRHLAKKKEARCRLPHDLIVKRDKPLPPSTIKD